MLDINGLIYPTLSIYLTFNISNVEYIFDYKKGVKNDPKMQHLKKYKIILFYFDPIPIY